MRRPIVFVTDYGRDDVYAAALIGAAWRAQPNVQFLEGTHGVPAGDILAGAYHLKALAFAFVRDAVFCAVVDPGVGTRRRCIAVDADALICVAPDNGLVSYLWAESPVERRRAVELPLPDYASTTFHGRDVFAPAAAQLADGMRLEDCGTPIDDPVILDEAFAVREGSGLAGRVAVVDHFGNAITTIRSIDLAGAAIASVSWAGGGTTDVVATYDEIPEGRLAALIGSSGHLEIAGRGVAAASLGGPGAHADVTLEPG